MTPGLAAAISHAVEHDELVLHYQPIVRVRTGVLEGLEALVRWDRPGAGLLAPAAFIPAAEKAEEPDLICEIDTWVLNNATKQLAAWNHTLGSRHLTVAVNVSGRHFDTSRIRDDVATALSRSGIDPGQLVLEITEAVPVGDGLGVKNLRELGRTGVTLSLDDFGTGYSSAEQLSRLPLDVVKIDRSYLDVSTATSRELFRTMVNTVHAVGLPVIAEGVEHFDQLELLTAVGVESAQGFFVGVPMAPAELEDHWRALLAATNGSVEH